MKNPFTLSKYLNLFTKRRSVSYTNYAGPGPGSVASSQPTLVGEYSWINTNNVFALDGTYASVTVTRDDVIVEDLYVSGFNFNIDPAKTITGITAVVHKKAITNTTVSSDWEVKLWDAGVKVGNDLRDYGNEWPAAGVIITYGGPTEMWGYAWTPEKVNHPGFGISISAHVAIEFATAQVDYITLEVHHSG